MQKTGLTKISNAIDSYINKFPKSIQKILKKSRQIIKKAAPGVEEGFAYQMPGYKLYGKPLVYFAAWKEHLGFYPLPSGVKAFEKELAAFRGAKGSVKFPYGKIPYALIAKIVKFRVKESREKFLKK